MPDIGTHRQEGTSSRDVTNEEFSLGVTFRRPSNGCTGNVNTRSISKPTSKLLCIVTETASILQGASVTMFAGQVHADNFVQCMRLMDGLTPRVVKVTIHFFELAHQASVPNYIVLITLIYLGPIHPRCTIQFNLLTSRT